MKILIVDDNPQIREALKMVVDSLGHESFVSESGEKALIDLKSIGPNLVISDLDFGLGLMTGIELVKKIKENNNEISCVVITGHSDHKHAFEAGKVGASGFFSKPINLIDLETLIKDRSENFNLRQENKSLRKRDDLLIASSELRSKNQKMIKVIETAKKIAKTDSTVLLTGESGTGKSFLAKLIHQESDRKDSPFVTVNCTTLSENLVESELFGHVRGSFTGASHDKIGRLQTAHNGTIFLDEIGEISPSLQTKLLRFLQEHRFEKVGDNKTVEVNVRILAATNKNLEVEVKEGRFREDLYYRLNVVDLKMPPLRERPEDLEDLAKAYLGRAFLMTNNQEKHLSELALNSIKSYNWPGNVRELQNALERAVMLSGTNEIRIEDLPDRIAYFSTIPDGKINPSLKMTTSDISQSMNLEDLEKIHIQKIMGETSTLEEAAIVLGINMTTLWRKRKRYSLD